MERKIIENLIKSIKHRTEEINNDIELLQSLISSNENMKDMEKTEVNQEEKHLFSVPESKISSTYIPPRVPYIPSSTGYHGNFYGNSRVKIEMSVSDYLFIATTVSKIIKVMDRNGNIPKDLLNNIKNSKIIKRVNKYLTVGDYLYISIITFNTIEEITMTGDVPKAFVKMINETHNIEAAEAYLYYSFIIENKYRIILNPELTTEERSDILDLCSYKRYYYAVNGGNIHRVKAILERILDKK